MMAILSSSLSAVTANLSVCKTCFPSSLSPFLSLWWLFMSFSLVFTLSLKLSIKDLPLSFSRVLVCFFFIIYFLSSVWSFATITYFRVPLDGSIPYNGASDLFSHSSHVALLCFPSLEDTEAHYGEHEGYFTCLVFANQLFPAMSTYIIQVKIIPWIFNASFSIMVHLSGQGFHYLLQPLSATQTRREVVAANHTGASQVIVGQYTGVKVWMSVCQSPADTQLGVISIRQ